jgi:hypothetical protein
MTEPRNSIRTYALVAVSLTSVGLIGFSIWLIYLLGVSDWCGRAVGAAKSTDRPEFAVSGCFTLLQQQVSALTINSFISLGTLALCLAVLVVIVIAGGKLSFKASAVGGIDVDMGSDPGAAAQVVADAAQTQADVVKAVADKPEGTSQ